MKKFLVGIAIAFATAALFAQSADYTKYLNLAKKYETEKRWAFALGAYYDALGCDDEPETKKEAYDGYMELRKAILSGNPGKGKYNVFALHDEWKKLLIDAEKYGSSINKYELTIGNLVQGDLDYKTKTASYSAKVEKNISDRYKKTIDVVKEGYTVAYKGDWSSDLPEPKEEDGTTKGWPLNSVSSNKDAVYNVNGTLVFAYEYKLYGRIYNMLWNAFAAEAFIFRKTLFDYKFNIVDENGKELVKGKRFLLGAEGSINFEGVTPEVMDLIDNGKAFVNPVAVYLEYGEYIPADDKGGRSFIKSFPEVTLNLGNAVFYGTNLKGDVKGKSFVKTSAFYANKDFKFVAIPDKNYSMSATEMTQFLYEAVMGTNPSYHKGEEKPVESVNFYDAIYFCNKFSEIKGKTPVYSVNGSTDVSTWGYEPHVKSSLSGTVTQNIEADGYRLPTQEEWVYAAKGGQEFKYSGSDNLDEVGWYKGNSGERPHAVATKKANGYGLYDMSGNVNEWCWDVGKYGRVYCGGGYNYVAYECDVSMYKSNSPYDVYIDLGFRIVCTNSN